MYPRKAFGRKEGARASQSFIRWWAEGSRLRLKGVSKWVAKRAGSLEFRLFFLFFPSFLDFIYLFLERGNGREKERERNIDRLPLARPQLDTCPTTQACALTGNQTGDLFSLQDNAQPTEPHQSGRASWSFQRREWFVSAGH